MGRTTSVTDPKGTVTTTSYDMLSRITQVVEDSGTGRINRTTTYSYRCLCQLAGRGGAPFVLSLRSLS